MSMCRMCRMGRMGRMCRSVRGVMESSWRSIHRPWRDWRCSQHGILRGIAVQPFYFLVLGSWCRGSGFVCFAISLSPYSFRLFLRLSCPNLFVFFFLFVFWPFSVSPTSIFVVALANPAAIVGCSFVQDNVRLSLVL